MTTQYMTWRISHGQLSVRLWDWGPHPVDEMIKMFFHLTWRRGHCVTCLFSGVDHDEREHVIIYVVWWNFLAQTMTLLDLPTQFRSFWIHFDSFIEMPYFSLYFVYLFVHGRCQFSRPKITCCKLLCLLFIYMFIHCVFPFRFYQIVILFLMACVFIAKAISELVFIKSLYRLI